MTKLHFRVLYREFLFRIVDVELLAPRGDMGRLLGQFAALLVIVSLWVMLPAALSAGSPPSELSLLVTWTAEHFLISTTMLAVGLFAVLSWDSLFPDGRDVLVLAPLPVVSRSIFAAKLAAVATALGVTVVSLNIFPGLAAPFAFSTALTMPPPAYEPAMAPVSASGMQAVLGRELNSRVRALGPQAGIAIGVLDRGERRVFTYGTARPDSLFEIGSITKTFTGLLLARMAARGMVRLDEPVRELLPPGTAARPRGAEITLLDLATQHSALPVMPDNFHPADRRNPYADYHAANLYAYIGRRGVARPDRPGFLYSNLGLGLLGQALANRAATSYAKLVESEIARPLGMRDTAIVLSPEQRERFLEGRSGNGRHDAVHAWDLDALAGAGGLRSTAGDMLNYLDAQLHPEKSGPLAQAIAESHRLRAGAGEGRRIALAWIYEERTGIYQHSGGTAGYTSYAFFDPRARYAAIVLINTGPNITLGPEQLGEHIRRRFAGEPALSLKPPVVPGSGGAAGMLRSFAAYWAASCAAGAFLLGLILTLQGLAQLLPRQLFLRASSWLQLASFCLLMLVYFLQPPFANPEELIENQRLLPWLPSYWFFSLFQQLNGPLPELLAPLARRAWMGLILSGAGAAGAYLVCRFRTLPRIAEQPDIAPARAGLRRLPAFGGPLESALVQFAIRTLLRSRQHRVLLAFYLGVAAGLSLFITRLPVLQRQSASTDVWFQVNAPVLIATVLMMCAAVAGTRVLFSMPLEIRANWIFRVAPPIELARGVRANRRTLYVLAIAPVLAVAAALLFWIWPWRAALGHLAVLGLVGAIAAELSLYGFRKIPFTCSYLPGKSQFHMCVIAFLGYIFLITKGAGLERRALQDPVLYAEMVAVLAAAAAAARRLTSIGNAGAPGIVFDEDFPPVIISLDIGRPLT